MQRSIFVGQPSVARGAVAVLRAVLVDDEPAALEVLRELIEQGCADLVRVEGVARSAAEARQVVGQVRPDILFLDVEMPEENGFEFLQSLPQREFAVIFVTAYDRYAIQALRLSAVDYLLKPVDPQELRSALERVWHQRHRQQERLQVLLDNFQQQALRRLVIPIPNGYQIVAVQDIFYLQSAGSYSYVFTSAGRLLTTQPIAQWEEMLVPLGFFRIHRAFLVNMHHVRQVRREREADIGAVVLTTGETLPVSRRRLQHLLGMLKQGR